jgi:transposase-like protein
MNGNPITASKRARIIEALRKGEKLAAIARHNGVSPTSVKKIRIEEGLQPLPTDEAKIRAAKARDVMLLDARRRRAKLMVDLLEDAEKLRTRMFAPTVVFGFGGKDYEYNEHKIPEPDHRGKQNLAIAMAVCIDKSLGLEKYDQEGAASAKAAIIDLIDRMEVAEAAEAAG